MNNIPSHTITFGSGAMPDNAAKAFHQACLHIGQTCRDHQRSVMARISRRAARTREASHIEGVIRRSREGRGA